MIASLNSCRKRNVKEGLKNKSYLAKGVVILKTGLKVIEECEFVLLRKKVVWQIFIGKPVLQG